MLLTRPRLVWVRSPQHFVDFDHPEDHPLLQVCEPVPGTALPPGAAPSPAASKENPYMLAKATLPADAPECQFGKGCTRKNPAHWARGRRWQEWPQ